MKFHRRMTLFTAVAVACYLGWVFGNRWWYARQAETRAVRKFSPLPAELSGSDLKIIHFYVTPAAIAPGGSALLCYGVLNATAISVEPSIGDVKPSLSRCVEIRTSRSTEYRLTATGAGRSETAVAPLEVKGLRK